MALLPAQPRTVDPRSSGTAQRVRSRCAAWAKARKGVGGRLGLALSQDDGPVPGAGVSSPLAGISILTRSTVVATPPSCVPPRRARVSGSSAGRPGDDLEIHTVMGAGPTPRPRSTAFATVRPYGLLSSCC
jgi:hypothetical protein